MMQILKHTSLCACFAAFSLMILSSPLQAQIAARSADLSGNLGFSNLSGSETVDGNKHLAFGGAGAYNFSDWGGIGFEYSYQMLGSETASGITVSGHIQSYGAVYRGYLSKSSRVVPYVLVAGGGLSETAVGSAQGAKVSISQNGEYFGFGGGASIFVDPSWGIRPELRYERQQFSAETVDGSSFAAYGQNYVLGTISVFYQFGGKQSSKR